MTTRTRIQDLRIALQKLDRRDKRDSFDHRQQQGNWLTQDRTRDEFTREYLKAHSFDPAVSRIL